LLTISGLVTYSGSGSPIGGVAVRFTSGNTLFDAQTNSDGFFSAEVAPGSWEISPNFEASSGSQIGSNDAAAVLEASVGMAAMPEHVSLAADVSANGLLSAYDAALILRRGQGSNQAFPAATACGSAWIFVPEPATAPNQVVTEPAINSGDCVRGAVSYTPLVGNALNQDFVAALFGDVDGSWQPGSP
jgi:hypothetical protein